MQTLLPTPFVCRIRRGSDNAEADIGRDASGNWDIEAIHAFLGGSDGCAVKYYGQHCGTGEIALTYIEQPRIVA